MGFMTSRKMLGFAVESVRYTAETLTAADYDIPAYNIQASPEIEEYERQIASGNFSSFAPVVGKTKGKVSFSVDLYKSASGAGVAPAFAKALKCVGFAEQVYAGVGVKWTTDSSVCYSATVEIAITAECSNPGQHVIKLKGCTGSWKLGFDNVGNPVRIDFEFEGSFVGVSDRAEAFDSTNIETAVPDSTLGMTIVAGGYSGIDCNSVQIDGGVAVNMEVDPSDASGYRGSHITGRKLGITIDPYLSTVAARNWYAQHLAPNTNKKPIYFKTANYLVYLPSAIVTNSLQIGDRDGLTTETITFASAHAPLDDEMYILQGAVS